MELSGDWLIDGFVIYLSFLFGKGLGRFGVREEFLRRLAHAHAHAIAHAHTHEQTQTHTHTCRTTYGGTPHIHTHTHTHTQHTQTHTHTHTHTYTYTYTHTHTHTHACARARPPARTHTIICCVFVVLETRRVCVWVETRFLKLQTCGFICVAISEINIIQV